MEFLPRIAAATRSPGAASPGRCRAFGTGDPLGAARYTAKLLTFDLVSIMMNTKEVGMGEVQKARVFRNGRSQAVRIPAQYRFQTDEVYVRRDPETGALTLSESPFALSLDEIYAQLDAAGAARFTLDRDSAPPSDREEL